jgi:hypothetical protein
MAAVSKQLAQGASTLWGDAPAVLCMLTRTGVCHIAVAFSPLFGDIRPGRLPRPI